MSYCVECGAGRVRSGHAPSCKARCLSRNPGPYGARCRLGVDHEGPHSPELDDVTSPPARDWLILCVDEVGHGEVGLWLG